MSKLKLAVYWASSCGGCDIALVELGEHLLELQEVADLVFWPCAMDFKYSDVEAMEDNTIDVTLFNGSIRTTEDAHIAHLMRAKSRVLVAFGSCAIEGCIPGLGNIKGADYALALASRSAPTNDNPDGILPQMRYAVPEGEITLPGLCERLRPLEQEVPIDYKVPGCPPHHDQVWKVMRTVMANRLPERGSTLGVDERTVCEQCPRTRQGKVRVERFYRVHEIVPDPDRCLLEQGLICAGPATHAGCGALCVRANMPCRGCYGAPAGVADQGAALLSAIVAGMAGQTNAEIDRVLATIADPLGTLYRFSLASSILQQVESDGRSGCHVTASQHAGEPRAEVSHA